MPTKRTSASISRVKLPTGNPGPLRGRRSAKLTAGVPLAKFIKPRLTVSSELVAHARPHSSTAQRFRDLGVMLDESPAGAARTIVVTSAGPAEGKSLVAMNLALTYAARREGPVLLLGGDLRRSNIGQWVRPAPKLGLTELLQGQTDLGHVLLELANNPLEILPAGGEPTHDPLELFVSDTFEAMMAELRERYARIVIDSPPIVPYTDADLLARFSDGVLVVARAGQTRRGVMAQALASVTAAPVLGTLLNDIPSE